MMLGVVSRSKILAYFFLKGKSDSAGVRNFRFDKIIVRKRKVFFGESSVRVKERFFFFLDKF